jgi:hypothetical protein
LDIGDSTWEAIEISSNGWRIIPQPEVRFVRPQGSVPLPRPSTDSGIETRLKKFLRLNDDQFLLLLVWLVAAMQPQGRHPILCLRGEGNSQLAFLIRSLIDPHSVPIRGVPRDEHTLMIGASSGWLVALTVRSLTKWLTTWIINLHTGVGLSAWQLYSDEGEILFAGGHPVILLVDEGEVFDADLRDVSLFISLPAIGPTERRTGATIQTELDQLLSPFFGYVLNVLVMVLQADFWVPPRLPHLADFALVGERVQVNRDDPCDKAFARAYASGRTDSAVIRLIVNLTTTVGRWGGTATSLLQIISYWATPEERASDSWPEDAASLGKQLRSAKAVLEDLGILIEFGRESGDERKRFINLSAGQGW